MPFGQRRKIIEKARSKGKRGKGSSSGPEIVTGTQVCLRSSPMYHIGAVGFTIGDGIPRVGQLMESAWTLNDTCRFKIKTTSLRLVNNTVKSSRNQTLALLIYGIYHRKNLRGHKLET